MGVQIPDGRTKMELAAEGVVGALTLLNDEDQVSVHMVDTEVHEIFPMSPVEQGLPLDEVSRGFSGGGGIFVGEALREGREQILRTDKPTRHVLLFSDAADSEEADDYLKTLAQLQREKVTVSVIGLGTEKDPDAALLKEIAARGGGRIYFAEDATSLPRIFSQETLAVARATFVDQPASLEAAPDLPLLGRLPALGLPCARSTTTRRRCWRCGRAGRGGWRPSWRRWTASTRASCAPGAACARPWRAWCAGPWAERGRRARRWRARSGGATCCG
jgi:hypothetical protein